MAITDKEEGVWNVDQVYNKINQGGIWDYAGDETELWSWGYNSAGQLGNNESGYNTMKSSPVQVGGGTWNLRSANSYHDDSNNAITKTDGTLWVWGGDSNGSLGLNAQGPSARRSSPTQVGTETTWAFAFTTYQNTFATKTDGTLWGWGGNGDGQMGINITGDPGARSSPTQIGTGTDWSTSDHCIAGSRGGVWALKADGTLWAWGDNTSGKLGQNQGSPVKLSSPAQVPGTDWRSLGAGYSLCWATKTSGQLWGWGAGGGQLGLNESTGSYSSPKQIPGTNWNTIVSGGYMGHTIATKTDGTLWTWGRNYGRGTLGQNSGGPSTTGDLSSPTQVGLSLIHI